MNWFYAKDGQQAGPVDDAELDRLVQTGTIADSTLVWHGGLANWQSYASTRVPVGAGGIPSGLPAFPSPVSLGKPQGSAGPGQAQCSQCGRLLPVDEVVKIENLNVCAECKPLFMQRLREGAVVGGRGTYAGFGIRFVAAIVDGLILIPVYIVYGVLVTLLAGGAASFSFDTNHPEATTFPTLRIGLQLLLNVLVWFYSGYCVSRFGGTPGKRICKLRVVTGDGSPVSLGRALCRYLAKFVSKIILAIGYLFIAFDDQKRGLHDMICDTRVIEDNPR